MTFNMIERVLKNGIILTIEDESKILSGDLWLVKLKVTTNCYLSNADDELKRFCGDSISKTKHIERPAVHEHRLGEVKMHLAESYLESTLPYMETARFLKKFKEKELRERLEKQEMDNKLRAAGIIP